MSVEFAALLDGPILAADLPQNGKDHGQKPQPQRASTEGINLALYCNWLVVEFYPSEKYEFVDWEDYSQSMEK